MINKMTQKLKELHSNLGLPEAVLTSVAGAAIIGLADDADDTAITARANEKSIADMLKSFQSHADKIRTEAQKAAKQQTTKGDEPPTPPAIPEALQKLLDEQAKTNQLLTERLAAIEKTNQTKTFDDMVNRIAKELNLSDAVLDQFRAGLSSDMDEKAVKDKLGALKKVLAESGARFEEKMTDQEESAKLKAAQEEAVKWAKEHEVKD